MMKNIKTNRRKFIQGTGALGFGSLLPSLSAHGQTSELAGAIDRRIKQMRISGRIASDESTAWLIYDLVNDRTLAAINEHVPMQCASMVKPLVIQAYLMCHFHKNSQMYPLSSKVVDQMREMIVHSNNEFTNRIMTRLGGPEGVQWMLTKQAPDIFRNINIVELIPNRGRTYRNRASASDYNRFLRALWANRLPGSAFLKELMAIPNLDRIRARTQYVPTSATVYDKTGSTSRLCGNTGIIECKVNGRSYPYAITGIIEKRHSTKRYSSWISSRSNVIREISDLCYLHFAQEHRLNYYS